MTFLHFFYQTRWALRNDPALGYVMAVLFVTTLEFADALKSLRQQLRGATLVHLMVSLESADAGREEK